MAAAAGGRDDDYGSRKAKKARGGDSGKGVEERDGFVLFWGGWPSQWFQTRFEVAGVIYNCAEQWMMAEKARLFGDDAVLQKILAAKDPKTQKSLGRKVSNFDGDVWNAKCYDIVVQGNIHKFSQNEHLRKLLLATGDQRFVEASPLDRIWGIGMGMSNPFATKPEHWRGTNLLGKALDATREHLRKAK